MLTSCAAAFTRMHHTVSSSTLPYLHLTPLSCVMSLLLHNVTRLPYNTPPPIFPSFQVENEELVFTLEVVVERFGDDIAPYAVGLAHNLVAAFWRYSGAGDGDGDDDDDDQGVCCRGGAGGGAGDQGVCGRGGRVRSRCIWS